MSLLFAAILGLVQGVAEFLPISSSGHLAILQNFFNIKEADLLFDVLLHFATLIAIVIVYWKDIVEMIKQVIGFFKDINHPKPESGAPNPARRLVLMLIIATLPLVIVLPFQNAIEGLGDSTLFVGIALLVTGGILFLSDRMKIGGKTEKNMTIGNALVIGLCQAVAVVPGISRSGTTITAGMATGLSRSFAVKFSFLLSLPAVLGATVLSLIKALKEGINTTMIPAYLLGMVVAFVSGFFAIKLVKMLAQKGKFGKFSYYCFAIGILTIILTIFI